MKTIGNISSIAVYAAMATVLAACSANPVENTNNKKSTVAAKAPVKIAKVVKKPVTKKIAASKVVAKKPVVSKPVASKLTKAQVLTKKKAIIAMASTKQTQKAATAARAKKVARAPIRVARVVVKKKPVAYRRPVTKVRSPQPVGVRSPQRVGSRSPQPVASRAQQAKVKRTVKAPVRYVAKRTVKAPVKYVAKRTVKTPVKYAAKRVVKKAAPRKPVIRVASRAPQARVVRTNYRKPVQATVRKAVYRKPARPAIRKAVYRKPVQRRAAPKPRIQRIAPSQSFGYALSNAAVERTKQRVRYDGSYVKIGYPWGDVPKSIGVCTDVVIRSYRRLGIDLQQEVHKDISKDFYAYPNLTKWGLEKPDPNIDHRRVYNLQAFFKRHKAELPRSRNPRDYKPGDLVTWMVGPTFPHIGVVVNKPSKADPNRFMIAHNVGAGPVIEDILFRFPMTGHYRYTPQHRKINPAQHFAKTPVPASVLRKRQRKQASYAQLLQASKYLNTTKPKAIDKQVKAQTKKPPTRLYLAQLDSVLTPSSSGLNSAAVQALLNKK